MHGKLALEYGKYMKKDKSCQPTFRAVCEIFLDFGVMNVEGVMHNRALFLVFEEEKSKLTQLDATQGKPVILSFE